MQNVTVRFLDDEEDGLHFISIIECDEAGVFIEEAAPDVIRFWYELAKAQGWTIEGERWLLDQYMAEAKK